MRTTVTLDPDVEQLIRDTMQKSRKSFKEVVNNAIRNSLLRNHDNDQEPFTVEPRTLKVKPGYDEARYNKLIDELEIESFMEAAEK